jgi:hypothetical protein
MQGKSQNVMPFFLINKMQKRRKGKRTSNIWHFIREMNYQICLPVFQQGS